MRGKKVFLFLFLIAYSFICFSCVINNYVIDDKPSRKKKKNSSEYKIEENLNNYKLKLFNFYVKDVNNEKHNILLRITIVCNGKKDLLKQKIKDKQKEIEKEIYRFIIRKKYTDFKLETNIEKLKKEIVLIINHKLKTVKVDKIYFSKLVVM